VLFAILELKFKVLLKTSLKIKSFSVRAEEVFFQRVILSVALFPFETHPTDAPQDGRVKMLRSLLRANG
jgi:hypothetical protein